MSNIVNKMGKLRFGVVCSLLAAFLTCGAVVGGVLLSNNNSGNPSSPSDSIANGGANAADTIIGTEKKTFYISDTAGADEATNHLNKAKTWEAAIKYSVDNNCAVKVSMQSDWTAVYDYVYNDDGTIKFKEYTYRTYSSEEDILDDYYKSETTATEELPVYRYNTTFDDPKRETEYLLTDDYCAFYQGALVIPAKAKVVFDLNGHTLDRNITKDRFFRAYAGGIAQNPVVELVKERGSALVCYGGFLEVIDNTGVGYVRNCASGIGNGMFGMVAAMNGGKIVIRGGNFDNFWSATTSQWPIGILAATGFGADITVYGGNFSNGEICGVVVREGATVNLLGGTFSRCGYFIYPQRAEGKKLADGTTGGAFFVQGTGKNPETEQIVSSQLIIDGAKFVNNAVMVSCGLFQANGGGVVTIKNCELSNNASTGSAVFEARGGNFVIENCKIFNNYGYRAGFCSDRRALIELKGNVEIFNNYKAPDIHVGKWGKIKITKITQNPTTKEITEVEDYINFYEDLYAVDPGENLIASDVVLGTFGHKSDKNEVLQKRIELATDYCGVAAVQPTIKRDGSIWWDAKLKETDEANNCLIITNGWANTAAAAAVASGDNLNKYFYASDNQYKVVELEVEKEDGGTTKEIAITENAGETNPVTIVPRVSAASQKRYNGEQQVIFVGYNSELMNYTVVKAPEGANVTFEGGSVMADLAGEYEIKFTLTDIKNYNWTGTEYDWQGNADANHTARTSILYPKVSSFVWAESTLKFNGQVQTPKLAMANYEGDISADMSIFTYTPCDASGNPVEGGGIAQGTHYVLLGLEGNGTTYGFADGVTLASRIKQYTIAPSTLTAVFWDDGTGHAVAAGAKPSFVYNGKVQHPKVLSFQDENGLEIKVDENLLQYTVSSGGVNCGSHTVVVSSNSSSLVLSNSMTGKSQNYEITALDMTSDDVTVTVTSNGLIYQGVNEDNNGRNVGCTFEVRYKGALLDSSLFKIVYNDTSAQKAGTATVAIAGVNATNIINSKTVTYEIGKYDIAGASLALKSGVTFTYDGTAKTLTVGTDVTKNNFLIKTASTANSGVLSNSDFTIAEYRENINAGTATVVIRGTGDNAEGQAEFTFNIGRYDITTTGTIRILQSVNPDKIEWNAEHNGIAAGEFKYNGTGLQPSVVVYSSKANLGYLIHGIQLDQNDLSQKGEGSAKNFILITPEGISKDFTLEYENNVNVGTGAIVKLVGKEDGNYSGSIQATFEIKKANIGTLDFETAKEKYYYTGVGVEPEITVTTEGITTNASDFSLTYKNNVAVKSYVVGDEANAPTVVIAANASAGNYEGEKEIYFSIDKAIIKGVSLSGMTESSEGKQSAVFDNVGKAPVATGVSFGEHSVDGTAMPENKATMFTYELRKSDGTVLGEYDANRMTPGTSNGIDLDAMAKTVGDYYVVLKIVDEYSGNFEFDSALMVGGSARVEFSIETAEFSVAWKDNNRNIAYDYNGATHLLNETATLKNVSEGAGAPVWYFKETKDGAQWTTDVPYIKDAGVISYYYRVAIENYAEFGGETDEFKVTITVSAVDIEKVVDGAQLFALDLYLGEETAPEYITNGTSYTGEAIEPKAKVYHLYTYAANKTSGMADYGTIADLMANGRADEKNAALLPAGAYAITYRSNVLGDKVEGKTGNYAVAVITPIANGNFTGEIEEYFEIISASVQDSYLAAVKGYSAAYDGQEHEVVSGYSNIKFPLSGNNPVTFYFTTDSSVKSGNDWIEDSSLWKSEAPKVTDVTNGKKTVYVKVVATGYATYYKEYEYEVTALVLLNSHVADVAGARYRGAAITLDEEFKVSVTTPGGNELRPVIGVDYTISYEYYEYEVDSEGNVIKDENDEPVCKSEPVEGGVADSFFKVGGKGVAIIEATGNYSGTVRKEFGIWGASEAGSKVSAKTDLIYSGEEQLLISNRTTAYTNGLNAGDPEKPDENTETIMQGNTPVETKYRGLWYWKVTREALKDENGNELTGAELKAVLSKEKYNQEGNTEGWISGLPTGLNAGTYYIYYAVDIQTEVGASGWSTISSDFGVVTTSVAKMKVYVDNGIVFDSGAGVQTGGIKVTTKSYDGDTSMPKENIDFANSNLVFRNAKTDAALSGVRLGITNFASAQLSSKDVSNRDNILTIRGLVLGGEDVDNYELSTTEVSLSWNKDRAFIKAIDMTATWYTELDDEPRARTLSVKINDGVESTIVITVFISNPQCEGDKGITLTPTFKTDLGTLEGISAVEGLAGTLTASRAGTILLGVSVDYGEVAKGNYTNTLPEATLFIVGDAQRVYTEPKTYQYDGETKEPSVWTMKKSDAIDDKYEPEYLTYSFESAGRGYKIESITRYYDGKTETLAAGQLPKDVGEYTISVSIRSEIYYYQATDGAEQVHTFDVKVIITQAEVTGGTDAVVDKAGEVANVDGKFVYTYTGENHNIGIDWNKVKIGSGEGAEAFGTQPEDITVEYRWSKDGGESVGSSVGMAEAGSYKVEILFKSATSNYKKPAELDGAILKIEVEVEISKLRIDVSDVEFTDGETNGLTFSYSYDGGVKALRPVMSDGSAELPEGLTVKRIEYYLGNASQGTTGVNLIGEYSARMYFGYGENYALYRNGSALTVDYIEATIKISDGAVDLSGVTISMPKSGADAVTYNGEAYKVSVEGLAGNAGVTGIDYMYTRGNVSNKTGATDAGDYTVTVTIEIASNYKADESKLPAVTNVPEGVEVTKKIQAGNVVIVAGFKVKQAPLTVRVNDVKVEYGETASNAGVEFEGLVGADAGNYTSLFSWSYQYTDKEGAYYAPGTDVSKSGGEVDVSWASKSSNYEIDVVKGVLTIVPREISVSWYRDASMVIGSSGANVAFEYEYEAGVEQAPYALAGNTYNKQVVQLGVEGGKSAIGTNYQATATLDTGRYPNYKLSVFNTKQAFSIMPKIGDAESVNKIVWSLGDLVYNGKSQAPTAGYYASTSATSLTPLTVKVTHVKVGESWQAVSNAVTAGTYKATIVSGGNVKFTEDSETEIEFRIVKAEVYVLINDVSANYGEAYELTWSYYGNSGKFATLADESGIKLSVAGENAGNIGRHAIVGEYAGNENYDVKFVGSWYAAETPDYNDVCGTLEISKGEIDATPSWGNLTYTYDGTLKTASVYGIPEGITAKITYEKDGVKYEGGVTNAGTYKVSVTFELPEDMKDNYSALKLNDTELVISKAALTITVNNASVEYGEAMNHAGVTYSGWAAGDDEKTAKYTGTLVYGTTYKAGDGVGTYRVSLDEGSTVVYDNYEVTYVPGNLTVTKRGLTIKWFSDATRSSEELSYAYAADTTFKPYAYILSGLYGSDKITYVLRREIVELSNGNYTTYYYDIENQRITLAAGATYLYVTGEQTGVGVGYTATATINVIGDGIESNYYVKTGETAVFNVLPTTQREIVWDNTRLVYNGTEQKPKAYYLDGSDLKELTVNGGAIAAGEHEASISAELAGSLGLSGELSKKYTIAPKAITVVIDGSGIDAVYGGEIDLSRASAALKDGSELAAGDDLDGLGLTYKTTATAGSDAGEYAITAEASNKNYAVTFESGKIVIKKATIDGTDIKWQLDGGETEYANGADITTEYTGETHVLTISALPEGVTGVTYVYTDSKNAIYTGGVKNSNVGEDKYTVKAVFTVDGNHEVYEGEVSVTLKITAKVASGLAFPVGVKVTYDGAGHGLYLEGDAEGVAGIEYKYYKKDGALLTALPVDAGEYRVTATVTAGANYSAPTIADGTFEIVAKSIKVVLGDAHVEYGEEAINGGYVLEGVVTGDAVEATVTGYAYTKDGEAYAIGSGAGVYEITASLTGLSGADKDNYTIDGSEVVSGALTVTPKELTVVWSSSEAIPVYETTNNGLAVGPDAELSGVLLSDDVSLVIVGNKRNSAGLFTAKVTGLSGADAGNYTLTTAGLSKNYEVRLEPPVPFAIVWDTTDHVYDGEAYKPSAHYYYVENGETKRVEIPSGYIRGEGTNVGTYNNLSLVDGYEKVAPGVTLVDGKEGVSEYFTNYTATYSIVKRPVTIKIDDVSIDYGDAVTTGLIGWRYAEGSLEFLDGYNVSFTTEATNASGVGKYKIIGSFSGEKAGNYDVRFIGSWIDADDAYNGKCGTWEIRKASLDVSQVTYVGTSVTYDGNAHGVVLSGLPEALNGKYSVSYVSDGGVAVEKPVNAGTYKVTFTFEEIAGYESLGTLETTMTIAKAGLTIKANDARTVYGEEATNAGVTYTGFVAKDEAAGASVLDGDLIYSYTYSKGNASVTEADEAKGKSAYQVAPSGLSSENYEITYVPGKLYVDKRPVTISWYYDSSMSSTNLVYSYDGSMHAPYAVAGNLVAGDSVKVTVKVGDDLKLDGYAPVGINIRATAVELSNSNYTLPESGVSTTFSIMPIRDYSVIWDNTTYYYDGAATKPVAYYFDDNGVQHYVPEEKIHIRRNNPGELETNRDDIKVLQAGTAYEAYIEYAYYEGFNNNAGMRGSRTYAFTVQAAPITIELSIDPAHANEFKYVYGSAVALNGDYINVSCDSALLAGKDVKEELKLTFSTVAGTAGNTDVGLYDITAKSGNSNFVVTVKSAQLEIVPKETDVSGVEFKADWDVSLDAGNSFEVEFSNTEYTVKVVAEQIPEGVESVSYEYVKGDERYENGVKAVGVYQVIARFTVGGNYTFKDGKDFVSCVIEITEKAVSGTIGFAGAEVVYNGSAQKLYVTGADTAEGIASVSYGYVKVEDGVKTPLSEGEYPVNVGEYEVTAKFESMPNYAAYADKTVRLVIKAKGLTVTPKVKTVKYGEAISEWAYTVSGLAGADTAAEVIGKLDFKVLDGETDVTAAAKAGTLTAGKYKVEIAGSEHTSANYAVTYNTTTLTVMNYLITAGEVSWYNDSTKSSQTLVYNVLDEKIPYAEANLTIDGKAVVVVFEVSVSGDSAEVTGIKSISDAGYPEGYFAVAGGIARGITVIPSPMEIPDGEKASWVESWEVAEKYVYDGTVQTPEVTGITGVVTAATATVNVTAKDMATLTGNDADGYTIEADVEVTYVQRYITVTGGSASASEHTIVAEGRRRFECDSTGTIAAGATGIKIGDETVKTVTETTGNPSSATVSLDYKYYTVKTVETEVQKRDENGELVFETVGEGDDAVQVPVMETVYTKEKDVELAGAPKDAGEYIVEVKFGFIGDGVDYGTTFAKTYEIEKRTVYTKVKDETITYGESVNVNDCEFEYVYDVEESKFVAGDTVGVTYRLEYRDGDNNVINPVNSGVYENALHMVLTGSSRNNYKLEATGATLTIEKAELSLDNLSVNTDSVVYDGAKHRISIGNLPNGVSASVMYVSRETGWSYTDGVSEAGVYDVTITFTLSANAERNFTTSGDLKTTFEIERAPLKIIANDNRITYGDAPSATGVRYQGFVGGDTVTVLNGQLEYSYGYTQGGTAGNYAITPRGLSATNYAIEYVSGTLEVAKRVVTITWYNDRTMTSQSLSYNYDGNTFKPYAVAGNVYSTDTVNLTVTGGQRAAGLKYTAQVTAVDNPNYALPQITSVSFDIIPPAYQIVWDNTEYTYNGQRQLPGAYYYDYKGERVELNVRITGSTVMLPGGGGAMDLGGVNAGTYIVTATVPTGLTNPETGEEYTLTGETYKTYNINRIKVVINISDVTVTYGDANPFDPNGWSYADGSGRFIGAAPITLVCSAAMDNNGNLYPNTESIGAGSWAIEATTTDENVMRNYDVTYVGSWSSGVSLKGKAGTFTVVKKVFAVPEIESVEYDGTVKIPQILQGITATNGIYTITSNGKPIYTVTTSETFDDKVRNYRLTLSLADTANYAWDGETNTTLVRYFVVTKATNRWTTEYQNVTLTMDAVALPNQQPKAQFGNVEPIRYYRDAECLAADEVTVDDILKSDIKGAVFYVLVEVKGTNEYTGLKDVYTITRSGTAALKVYWEGMPDAEGVKVEYTSKENLPKAYVLVMQPDGSLEKVYVETEKVGYTGNISRGTHIAGVKTCEEKVDGETTYYLIATAEYADKYNTMERLADHTMHMTYCVYTLEDGEDPDLSLSQIEYEIVPMKLTINISTASAGVYANKDGLKDADVVTTFDVEQTEIPDIPNINKNNLIERLGLTFTIEVSASDYDARGNLKAGKYALVIAATSETSKNYEITFVGDWAGEDEYAGKAGVYEVEAAEIALGNNSFDIDVERNQKVTIGFGKDVTIDLTDEVTLAGGTPVGEMKIEYINEAYTTGDKFCIDDPAQIEALFRNQWQDSEPAMARSATYCVYYRMTLENHETKYGYFKVTLLVNGQAVRVYFNSQTLEKAYGDEIDSVAEGMSADGNLIDILIEKNEETGFYESKYIREADAAVLDATLTGHPYTESAGWASKHLETLKKYANAYAVDEKGNKVTRLTGAGTYAIAFEFNDAAAAIDTEYVAFAYRGSSADEETNNKYIVTKRVLEATPADQFTYTGEVQIPDIKFANLFDETTGTLYAASVRDGLDPEAKIELDKDYEITLRDGGKLIVRYGAVRGFDNISATAPMPQMVMITLTSDNYEADTTTIQYLINAHNLDYKWENESGNLVAFTYDGTQKLPVLVITDAADGNRQTRVEFTDEELIAGVKTIELASGETFDVTLRNASMGNVPVEDIGMKQFTVTIAAKDSNGYKFSRDGGVVAYITCNVQINARGLSAAFGSTELYYTGEAQVPVITLDYGGEEPLDVKITAEDIAAGKKVVELTEDMSVTINLAIVGGNATDVQTGKYSLTLSTADGNYSLGATVAEYTISENELSIEWSGVNGTYDGTAQKPVATVKDKYGNTATIDFSLVEFEETTDGDGNTVYVAKDYVIEDLSGVEVVVDIVFEGSIDGITAGDYKATITPKDPGYAADASCENAYEIAKAEVTAKWYYNGTEWNGETIEAEYGKGVSYAENIEIVYGDTHYKLSEVLGTTLNFDGQPFVIPNNAVSTAGEHEIVLGNDNFELMGGAFLINVAKYELEVALGNNEFYYMGNVVTAPKITITDTRTGEALTADLGEALAALNGGAKTATAVITAGNGEEVSLTLTTTADDLHAAGNYTLTISSANGNYKLTGANADGEGTIEVTVKITRREVTLAWQDGSFLYDGTAKLPKITLSYDMRNENGGIEAGTTQVTLTEQDVKTGSVEVTLDDGAVIVINLTATKNGAATTNLAENYLLRARVTDTGYSLVNVNGNNTVEYDVVVAARQLRIDLLDEEGNVFNPQYTGEMQLPVIRVTDTSDGSFVDVRLTDEQIQQLVDTEATTFTAAFANGYSVEIVMSFSNGNNLVGDKSSGGNQVFKFTSVSGLNDISGATDFVIRGNGFTLGAGAIVGIVLGGVALIAAIVVLIILLKRRSAMQGEFIDEQGFDDEYDDEEE